jgi:hypothetical protein
VSGAAGSRAATAKGALVSDNPDILITWGDDMGISNLSCYSDGVMGYRTRNIDRIAEEGCHHRLLGGAGLHRWPGGVHHPPEPLPHRLIDERLELSVGYWMSDDPEPVDSELARVLPRVNAGRIPAWPSARGSRQDRQSPKTVAQSFVMLAIVQPDLAA